MLGEDDEVRVAAEAARRLAARWRRPHEWRDYLSAAWEGVRRANRRGVADARGLATAACRAVIDRLRVERPADPTRRRNGRRRPPAHVPGDAVLWVDGRGRAHTLFDALAAPPRRPDPGAVRRGAWEDARHLRAGLAPRARVALYLWVVEGWTFGEIAAAWGVSPSAVSHWLAGVTP